MYQQLRFTAMIKHITFTPVSFACHASEWKDGEEFVAQHSLGLVVSGQMELDYGTTKNVLTAGDVFFIKKNQLLKFKKLNGSEADFKTITLFFDDKTLLDFASEFGYKAAGTTGKPEMKSLVNYETLKVFMESLLSYEGFLENDVKLSQLKQKEALLLLMQDVAAWQDVLFDFTQPVKADLSPFMEQNFLFNVPLERFAYLTGRSLTSFKRDFKALYDEPPARWILKKRLASAYELIVSQHKTSVEIYLELGFQDLSHFSYVFKKQYGIAPSLVAKQS